MNGDESGTTVGDGSGTRVVTANLPNGVPIRVEVSESESTDGMANVGLRDLDLGRALEAVGDISSVVVDKLKTASPARTIVELRLGFAVEAGKLTALWVGGRAEASLTVTMEWGRQDVGVHLDGPTDSGTSGGDDGQ
jgi:hypothetical protein